MNKEKVIEELKIMIEKKRLVQKRKLDEKLIDPHSDLMESPLSRFAYLEGINADINKRVASLLILAIGELDLTNQEISESLKKAEDMINVYPRCFLT